MGVKYVHVNTRHLTTQETSVFNVHLSEPLKNVTHVEAVSFSSQNDFYNIQKGNNNLRFVFRGPGVDDSLDPADNVDAIYEMKFTITPGFYTHADMINEINNEMIKSSYCDVTATGDGSEGVVLAPKLTVGYYPVGDVEKRIYILFSIADGKTVITMGFPVGEPINRINWGFLSYLWSEGDEFHNSIWNRLGFGSHQVLFTAEKYVTNKELFAQTATTSVNINYDKGFHDHRWDSILDQADFVTMMTETYHVRTNHLEVFTKTFQIGSTLRNIKISNRLAWETHEGLVLTTDLVNDFESTTHNYPMTGRCEPTNTLVRVPIQVNRASWVHYISRENEAVHDVCKPLIRSFNLSMQSSHSRKPFHRSEYQSFAVTLKFTTKDDEVEQNIRQYESIERGSIRTQNERV